MKAQQNDTDDSWCTSPETEAWASKEGIANSEKRHTSKQGGQEEQTFTDAIRGLFYGEEREPTETIQPDRIESHRMIMESPKVPESPKDLVTQNYYGCEVQTEKRVKRSMLKLANQTLDQNEIIKRYLGPGTETNNSAMLFLAGTLFSSNRFIFEFLNENGFFRPASQKVVNALASDFTTQGQQLCKLLLRAERSSTAAIKNAIVSCVNNFVCTSNKLADVLEEDYAAKAAAVGSAKNGMVKAKNGILNNIIATRNQISNALYDLFERTLEVDDKSLASAYSGSSAAKASKNVRFLSDAEEFTNLLVSGIENDRLARGDNGIEVVGIAEKETVTNENRIPTQMNNNTRFQYDDETTDPSDMLSTASSFLDFINGTSLSAMFDEDEQDLRDAGVPDVHLDAIFDRMNLEVPKEHDENDDISTMPLPSNWGDSQQTKPLKLTAREKRRLMMIARTQAKQEKKQRNMEKKKARAKEQSENKEPWKIMGLGRKSRKRSQGKPEVLVEI